MAKANDWKELTKLIPQNLKMMVCRENFEHADYFDSNCILKFEVGEIIKVIGICILDQERRLVYYKDSTNKSCRYAVEFHMGGKLLCDVKTIHTYIPQERHTSNDQQYWSDWNANALNPNKLESYYCYNDVMFKNKGEQQLVVKVVDKHVMGLPRVVLEQAFTINVTGKCAKSVEYHIDTSGIFTFGDTRMPLFHFVFVDESGEAVAITNRVRIKLTLPYEPNVTVRYFNGISIEEGDPKFQVCDVAFLDLCNNAIDFTICRWKQMTVVFYNVQTFLCWKKM